MWQLLLTLGDSPYQHLHGQQYCAVCLQVFVLILGMTVIFSYWAFSSMMLENSES